MFRVIWGRGHHREFESADEIRNIVTEIAQTARMQQMPLAVEISANDESAYLLTVGSDQCFVQFCRKPINGRNIWFAVTDTNEDDLIEFDYMGEISQMARRHWVSAAKAMKGLDHYLSTGTKDEAISWH